MLPMIQTAQVPRLHKLVRAASGGANPEPLQAEPTPQLPLSSTIVVLSLIHI